MSDTSAFGETPDFPLPPQRPHHALHVFVLAMIAALAFGGSAADRAQAAGSCSLPGVKTFTGPGTGWFAASNWTPTGVPTNATDVCIPAGGVTIGTGATANAASVEANGPINLSSGELKLHSTTQQSDIHSTLTLSGGSIGGAAPSMSTARSTGPAPGTSATAPTPARR